MLTRTLGPGGLSVSAFCLGTMDMGTSIPRERSFAVLDAFVEAGGTFIDTANIYAFWNPGGRGGESECLLGDWLRERRNRDRLVIATKVGGGMGVAANLTAAGDGDGDRIMPGTRAAQVIGACERSLTRLGVEVIDLFFAHLDFRDIPQEETLEAFDRLVRQGKVRAIAASNHTAWRLERARQLSRDRGWAGYCCIQQRHSYLRALAGTTMLPQLMVNDDMLDYCRSEHLPILAYTPLLGGCYARDEQRLPPQYHGADTVARLAAVRAVARESGVSPNQVVLAWMLHSDPQVIPVVATGRVEHLRENLAAADLRLPPAVMERLDRAGACQARDLVLIAP